MGVSCSVTPLWRFLVPYAVCSARDSFGVLQSRWTSFRSTFPTLGAAFPVTLGRLTILWCFLPQVHLDRLLETPGRSRGRFLTPP
ncbi:hypothetical protein K402DRAFT_170991 [Aulographum hederae CBS 113979]|uniref:Uncharacterized protein n=1 Tax=Aulographum hederae CBS 113979 TaxID=1176131 RepID=A0A6G1HDS1_9PEZI|nr:hypothetical protein K402DRAFT_170991 [Aulographum hederae CBS 113979]